EGSRIAYTREHEAVPDPLEELLVTGQPDDRPDGARHEHEPVRVAERYATQRAAEKRSERDAGEVVVGERGMAHVAREQDLALFGSRNHALPVGERSGFERRVDDDLVLPVGQPGEVGVRGA